MDDCLFCKIINSEIPSYKIYEDADHLAILDAFPTNKAQTLVITKKHHTSKFTKVDEDVFLKLMAVTREVARHIEDTLENVERCQLVFEGFHVDHIHAKLYPAYLPDPSKDGIIHMGEKASDEELTGLKKILETEKLK